MKEGKTRGDETKVEDRGEERRTEERKQRETGGSSERR